MESNHATSPPADPAADLTTTIAEEGARALYAACRQAFIWLADLRTDELLPIVAKQGAIAGADLMRTLADAIELSRSGERRAPRVLIEVFQGIADYHADAGVNVVIVDYDAGQAIPPAYEDLASKKA